jgi:nucleoside-diphosphate-sugar epimerase
VSGVLNKYMIIGCGSIGRQVAIELLRQEKQVLATTHSVDSEQELEQLGLTTLLGDFDYRDQLPELPLNGCKLFYFMPPQGGGTSDYRMLNFCRQLSESNCPERIVYISTSGVYGDCGDIIVNEETPVNPQTSRAKRRVNAEQQLRQQAEKLGFSLTILRVTGIYGPGRLPLAQLTEGHQVLRPEDAPITNRIHSADLVRICLAAMEQSTGIEIYNVCDGEGSSMSDFFIRVAELFDLPQPQQLRWEEAEKIMNPLTLSFLRESRQMTNQKLLQKLKLDLLYPTLDAGLKACR